MSLSLASRRGNPEGKRNHENAMPYKRQGCGILLTNLGEVGNTINSGKGLSPDRQTKQSRYIFVLSWVSTCLLCTRNNKHNHSTRPSHIARLDSASWCARVPVPMHASSWYWIRAIRGKNFVGELVNVVLLSSKPTSPLESTTLRNWLDQGAIERDEVAVAE